MKSKLLTTVLLASASLGFAGEPAPAKGAVPVQPKPPENPLSFYDGKLIFDFQERLRFEIRDNNFDFNNGVNALTDDSWLLQRARLGMKITPNDWFSFYVQGQSSFEIDSDRPNIPGVLGAEGDDPIDLRQAYIKLGRKDFNVTIGRQLLSYGDERLVGGFDWNNIGRTFDAVKVHYGNDAWSLEGFASSVVVPNEDEFNQSDLFDGNDTGRNQIFSGLYFSNKSWLPFQVTDAYVFHLHEEYSVGNTNFFTLGSRVKADPKKLNGFDYEAEMALQLGEVKGGDLTAFAGHWGAGYNWLDSPIKPRLGIEYNYATGDGDPADGDVDTFQNLFPTNHKFYGYMDVFSWQNMHNPAVSFSVLPCKTVKLQLDYHAFWLAETNDGWYRANGVTKVRPVKSSASNFVGTELDFTATWKATKNLSFLAGYSHFFTGDYAKATGAADDADFGYVQATLEF